MPRIGNIEYNVGENNNRKYIYLNPKVAVKLAKRGAKLELLTKIGDRDPAAVMRAFLEDLAN